MNLNVNGKAPEKTEDEYLMQRTPMALIGEISRLMGDKIREKGDENPISQRSGRLLLGELSKKDGRTQLDLVNATHLKAPTISVALQALENDGIVLRMHDEKDKRATRVYLTDKGKELDKKIRKRIHEEESLATDNLTDGEIQTLMRILTKVKQNLIKDKEEGDLF